MPEGHRETGAERGASAPDQASGGAHRKHHDRRRPVRETVADALVARRVVGQRAQVVGAVGELGVGDEGSHLAAVRPRRQRAPDGRAATAQLDRAGRDA